MTYFYNREDLPEVVPDRGGYMVEGRWFDIPEPAESFLLNEIDILLALLHHVQDEEGGGHDLDEPTFVDTIFRRPF